MKFEDIVLGKEYLCKYNEINVKVIGKDLKCKDIVVSYEDRKNEHSTFSENWGEHIGDRIEVVDDIDRYRWLWVEPEDLEEISKEEVPLLGRECTCDFLQEKASEGKFKPTGKIIAIDTYMDEVAIATPVYDEGIIFADLWEEEILEGRIKIDPLAETCTGWIWQLAENIELVEEKEDIKPMEENEEGEEVKNMEEKILKVSIKLKDGSNIYTTTTVEKKKAQIGVVEAMKRDEIIILGDIVIPAREICFVHFK